MNTQKGFTMTEIMVSIGVVSALMINGYNFYSNAIAKAQANEAMTAAKKVIDGVIDFHARFEDLPATFVNGGDNQGDSTGNLSGSYEPLKDDIEYLRGSAGSVASAQWVKVTTGANADAISDGYVEVTFKTERVQKQIAGERVRFYLQQSENLSHVDYLGCRTSIASGDLDGDTYAQTDLQMRSPILPECYVNLIDVPGADRFGLAGANGNRE